MINELIIKYKEINDDIKFKKGMLDEVKKEIKEAMKTKGVKKLMTDEGSVTFSSTPTFRFQTTLFKEKEPDQYEKYLKESVVERLTVK